MQSLVNDSIVSILREDEDDSEFLCLMKDGSMEWMELEDDSPLVKTFRDLWSNLDEPDLLRVDAADWAKGLVVK